MPHAQRSVVRRRRGRGAVAAALGALAGVMVVLLPTVTTPASASTASRSARTAQPDGLTADDQRLVDRYRPVVMLRTYDELCGDEGEPYVPMTVDPLLGNREVALRQVGNRDAVIRWAPSARELYGLGSATYLDLPGDSLNPGCTYATYQQRYTKLADASVYAHIATQTDEPGYVAVQYWFYWYYNDWNDRHESDWEFIQVLFRADTVAAALAGEPASVGYAQHTGGETHTWDSSDLQREGTHPVVYPSEGSHASYFAQALYLGRGASEGFGCDNTQAPSTRIEPRAVLLPDQPSGPDDPFAWLAYQGRWGERQSGPNNGPDGPAGKPRWTEPVSWQEGLRPSSFEIPGGSEAPPAIIGAFCTVVEQGSQVYLNFASNPSRSLLILAVLLLLVIFILRRTSWARVPALPIVARRRAGEIVRAAFRVYRRRPLAFLIIGLLAVPVGVVGAVLSAVLTHLPFVGDAVTVSTDRGDPVSRALISAGVSAGLWPVTVLLVSSAVAHLMHQGETGATRWTASAAVDAIRVVFRRGRDLAAAFVLAAIAIVVLQLSVIGVPAAAWLSVRYQFVGQAVILDDARGWAALRASSKLVRHRWWHTAMFAFVIWSGVHTVGVLLGLILLITVTTLPLWSISLVVMLAEIALTPLGAIALTLLFGDAVAEQAEAETTAPDLAGV